MKLAKSIGYLTLFILFISGLIFQLFSYAPNVHAQTTLPPPTIDSLVYDFANNTIFGNGSCSSGSFMYWRVFDANGIEYVSGTPNTNTNAPCIEGTYSFLFDFNYWKIPNTKDLNLQNKIEMFNIPEGRGSPVPEDLSVVAFFTRVPPNTVTGINIVVGPLDRATLTFEQVIKAGETTLLKSSIGTTPPTGFRLGNPVTYYSISTTATFIGNVEVCINYDETTISGNEINLKLMYFISGQGWIDATTSLDTTNNIVCGVVTEAFFEFGVMTQPTIQDLIDRVREMNLQQGIQNSLDVKLQAAQDALSAKNEGLRQTAMNKLNSFINEVEAQRGNKITNLQANELRSFAGNLIKIVQDVKIF